MYSILHYGITCNIELLALFAVTQEQLNRCTFAIIFERGVVGKTFYRA